jgi:hypothetical protein
MKKSTTKLQLKTSTIRLLQDRELTEVRGGEAALRPSVVPTHCSATLLCLLDKDQS